MATADRSLPEQVSPPAFEVSDALPHALRGERVLAVPVVPAESGGVLLGPGADDVADLLDVDLLAVAEEQEATGAAGEVLTLPVPAGVRGHAGLRTVLLVGVGEQRPVDFRRAGAALARATRDRDVVATTVAAMAPDDGLEAFVVGAMLASFSFRWSATPPGRRPPARIVLAGLPDPASVAPVLERAVAVGDAAWLARHLATVPSNVKNPAWLAAQATDVAQRSGLKVAVWDEKRLAAEGFGGILGVGQASASPPRLIRLDYTPAAPSRATRTVPTVVLVGKGITFDSGGLSIKPAEGMVTMKRDMTGGAVVIATMAALAAVRCPVRVVGLVPTAENAVSGHALRPGDVIRHWGGRTSEVTNTDAEGRLVLGDALAYAVAEVKPAAIVDVATLTGAMKVALGLRTGGFFANHEQLADAIRRAGEEAGEPLWRLPLADVYEDKLRSQVADADNGAGGPGAITAALFLQHFVGDVPWAHLDVASVGDSPDDRHEWTPGPTGFGARALLRWLGSADPLAGIA